MRVLLALRAVSPRPALCSRVLNQRPAHFCGWLEIVEDGIVDLPEILPRVLVAVKAVQEEHVGDEALHPVDVRRVAEDGAAAGSCEKLFGESLSGAASKDTARGEVNEVGFYAETLKRVTEILLSHGFEHRDHFTGRAVKCEIKDRRIGGGRVTPEQPVRRRRVVRQATV